MDEAARGVNTPSESVQRGPATVPGLMPLQVEEANHIHIETTYTGKALAALVADARAGKLVGKTALFWNTYNSR